MASTSNKKENPISALVEGFSMRPGTSVTGAVPNITMNPGTSVTGAGVNRHGGRRRRHVKKTIKKRSGKKVRRTRYRRRA